MNKVNAFMQLTANISINDIALHAFIISCTITIVGIIAAIIALNSVKKTITDEMAKYVNTGDFRSIKEYYAADPMFSAADFISFRKALTE